MGQFDELLGPMLLGLTLNALFMGALLIQYYTYWTGTHRRDSAMVRMVVAFLMLADLVNTVLDLTFVWLYTVTHFGDTKFIQQSDWVFNTDPVMTVIISSTVQSFFAWRVNKLTHRRWLYIVLNISAFIQLLAGLGTTIGCSIVKDFAKFQSFQSIVIVWLSLSAVTDIVIAAVMVQYLRRHRTGVAATEDLIQNLVKFAVQTGVVTSLWAVVDLIVYLSLSNNLHLIFNMALSKLYSNACLSSLNARAVWSGDSGSHTLQDGKPSAGVNILTTSTIHRDAYEMDGTIGSPNGRTPLPNTYINYNSRRLSRVMTTQRPGVLVPPSPNPYDDDEKGFVISSAGVLQYEKDVVRIGDGGDSPDTHDEGISDGASTIKDA